MDREQIIQWAREANRYASTQTDSYKWQEIRDTYFAKLVAVHERETCAMVCEELQAPDVYNTDDKCMWDISTMDCAEAIRARGNT
jgi:hypothetical protein